ncbi:MAG: response regulator transcription factor [Candidatus Melainabacteria bacterium]|nr:MAG: response regulator transcription factor [Candidatus Melainabacteria bacterium]
MWRSTLSQNSAPQLIPTLTILESAMNKVLLAEDDDYLLKGLLLALQRRGYSVTTAKTGAEAQAALLTDTFDLLLLDLGLPGIDGTQILSELRARGNDVPVIIITARDGLEDRINGLDLGANDYLVKPFDFRELEARARAVLRKTNWNNQVEIEFGSLKLNTNNGVLQFKDDELDLTPKETIVLKTLMAKAGRVVSKRQIMNQVSDHLEEASENAVEIVIHRLRKKLESARVLITTVRGFGYLLTEERA